MTKVLIVEDQAPIRQLIRMTLDFLPCTILETHNGQDAMALYNEHQPELVLLDVMLPGGMTGIDICKAIKATPGCTTKIIMMSAKAQLADQFDGLSAGADEYLTKPFSITELIQQVHRLVPGL